MKINDIKYPYIFLSTGFGVGFIPFAPGTMGSALGLCIYILYAHLYLPLITTLLSLTLLLFIGWYATKRTLEILREDDDHQEIVIDEIVAMMFVAVAIPPDTIWAIAGFLIFRFFDIVKLYPASLVDEKYKNAFGIMCDDMIAAVYSIALIIISRNILG